MTKDIPMPAMRAAPLRSPGGTPCQTPARTVGSDRMGLPR